MYPIYFKDNTCVKCGSKNIVTLDANNEIISDKTSRDIRKVMCTNCKSKYILQWDGEDDNYPIDRYNIKRFKEKFNN